MKINLKSVWLPLVLVAPFALSTAVTPAIATEQPAVAETTGNEELPGDTGNGAIVDERDEGYGDGIDFTGSSGGG